LLKLTESYSDDISRRFGTDRCKTQCNVKDTEADQLFKDGSRIQAIKSEESYKYLVFVDCVCAALGLL
jgi:hypothetical protein